MEATNRDLKKKCVLCVFVFLERHGKVHPNLKRSTKCLLPSLYTDGKGKENQMAS